MYHIGLCHAIKYPEPFGKLTSCYLWVIVSREREGKKGGNSMGGVFPDGVSSEQRGRQGIEGAAQVGKEMEGNAESVERLGRILYNHYDRKGDSQNAVIFNNLVTEWQRIREKMSDDEQLNIPI